MAQEAVFLQAKPRSSGSPHRRLGGRKRGVHRAQSPDAALITYYQASVTFFGKMSWKFSIRRASWWTRSSEQPPRHQPCGMVHAAQSAARSARRHGCV